MFALVRCLPFVGDCLLFVVWCVVVARYVLFVVVCCLVLLLCVVWCVRCVGVGCWLLLKVCSFAWFSLCCLVFVVVRCSLLVDGCLLFFVVR